MTNVDIKTLQLLALTWGRSVGVIGGASDIVDWSLVADCDILVRINHHYEEQGGRVDWLYLAPEQTLKSLRPRLLLSYSGLHQGLANADVPICLPYYSEARLYAGKYGVEHEWLNTLCHKLKTTPLTGIIAIAHILTLPISTLCVTGFDFYKSGSVHPYRRDAHQILPQLEWLRETIAVDKRIQVDCALNNIITYGYTISQVCQVSSENGVSTIPIKAVIP